MSQIPSDGQNLPGTGANGGTHTAVRIEDIVIVSRTRMGGGYVCVGGLVHHSFESVRLMQPNGFYNPVSAPYQVGEVYRVSFVKEQYCTPPHVENVRVQSAVKIADIPSLLAFLQPKVVPWQGSINSIFGGTLEATTSGNMHCRESFDPQPSVSTGFWIPDRPLAFRDHDAHYRYPRSQGGMFANLVPENGLKYVGFENPLAVIPAGTLVRVSLAKYWDMNGKYPDNKWAFGQLSGWYL